MNTCTARSRNETQSSRVIKTTLYDLIEAVNEAMQAGEEEIVVATVMHLLETSRVTFPRQAAHCN